MRVDGSSLLIDGAMAWLVIPRHCSVSLIVVCLFNFCWLLVAMSLTYSTCFGWLVVGV
jgi:hypothetical protein